MTTTNELATRLQHPDNNIRMRAALELGISSDPAAAPILVGALGPETDSRVRGTLTWATVQHAEESFDELVALLDDPDGAVRHQVLHVLSKIGGRRILPHVLALVDDADPRVAAKAYRAAATTGAPEAVAPLVARLGEGDADQRDQLTRALLLLGADSVIPLVDALANEQARVRSHAADVLAEIGSPDADPAVDGLARLVHDTEPDVRLSAVTALGELGTEEATDALVAVAKGDDTLLAAIARHLLGA